MGKYIPPPILDELKKVDLVTYFRTIMPYELVKVSANEYTTKTHDSLRMSNGLWNWCSRGFGGKNAIDFIQKTKNMKFNEEGNLIGVNVIQVFNDRFKGLLALMSRTID